MPKFTKITLDTLRNDATAVAAINENFSRLETLLDQMVSRDGTSPNTMDDIFDMNQHRLVNLPFPLSPTEPVRLQDITDATEDLAALMEDSLEILQEANDTANTILPQMEAFQDNTVEAAELASTAADTAVAAAEDAEEFAEVASNAPAAFLATSSTSLAVGTGSKVFTTQAGKYFAPGQFIVAAREGGSEYMYGTVDSYSGTTLTVTVTASSGSGSYTDWVLSMSGIPGPQGEQGSEGPGGPGSGDVLGPEGATDNHVVLFDGTTGKLLKSSGVTLGNIANATLSDPGADRIVFWDDSTGIFDFLQAGNGLTITDQTMAVNPGTGLGISGATIAITDAQLLALASVTSATDTIPYFTGSTTADVTAFTATGRSLVGAASTTAAKTLLSLENVSNTSDASKPISTATQTALNAKLTTGLGYGNTVSRNINFTITLDQFGCMIHAQPGVSLIQVPSDAIAAFPVGSVVYVYHNTNTVTYGTWPGAGLSAQFGVKGVFGAVAVLLKVAANFWVLQGGVTT